MTLGDAVKKHFGSDPHERPRIVLTGASRGIGAAIARELAHHARWICLVGRDATALQRVQASLGSVQSVLVVGDIAQSSVQAEVVAAVGDHDLDILINNAGVSEFGNAEGMERASLERLMEINLITPIALTQQLLPALRRSGASQIVNVGSTFAYIGYPGFAAYCASKFGLRGFTEALDRELADSSVRVRLFSPRATATDINSPAVRQMNQELGTNEDTPEQVASEFIRFLRGTQREGRVGRPEKIFTRLNQWAPAVVDRALKGQLARIKKAFTQH